MGFNCKGKLCLFTPIHGQSNHVISLSVAGLDSILPSILHGIDLTKSWTHIQHKLRPSLTQQPYVVDLELLGANP